MKKILLGFFLFIFALVLAACGNDGGENAAENEGADNQKSGSLYDEIMEKGVLTVGTEGTYAPSTFHNEEGTDRL